MSHVSHLAGDDEAAGVRRLLAAYLAVTVTAVVVFLVLGRAATFRGDDWDFVANRSLADPVGLMRPFNLQWVAFPAAVFRVVYAVVGLSSYLPYLVVLLVFHALAANETRRVVTHVAGRRAGFIAGVLILFLGSAAENFNNAFQISMVSSTFFGLAALDVRLSRRSPALSAGLLTLAVASHAVGAVFVVVAIILAAVRERSAIPWLCIPIIAFAAWFVAFDATAFAARPVSTEATVGSAPGFILVGISSAAGAVFGGSLTVGVAVLAVLSAVAVLKRPPPQSRAVLIAAIAGLIFEFALVAASRADYGVSAANWSRYRYTAVPLLLLAAAPILGSLERPRWLPTLATPFGLAITLVAACWLNIATFVSDLPGPMFYVHQSRAEVAIILWTTAARPPTQDPHLPAPDLLRDLVSEAGSPLRDVLIPSVVPPIPYEVARATCLDMVHEDSVDDCVDRVLDEVGRK